MSNQFSPQYPIIQFVPLANGGNDQAGSLNPPFDSDGTNSVVIRRGSFVIFFSEFNPYGGENVPVFSFPQQSSVLGADRKKSLHMLFTQMQYADFSTSEGFHINFPGSPEEYIFAARTYELTAVAYNTSGNLYKGQTSSIGTILNGEPNSHYYPLDLTECIQYNTVDDQFEFNLSPLLDDNGNVINCNTIFKGIYTLA